MDADRSADAVLHAALRVLGQRPEASIEEIAATAGVSRQTVYAHYPSRQALLAAVIERITHDVLATIDAARLDDGPPTAALLRWLDTSWQLIDRYPLLVHPSIATASPQESQDRHLPITGRLQRLIERGQDSGDFDRTVPAAWLLTATMALGHAAGDEVGAGRMTSHQARHLLHDSVLRLYSATPGE